MKRIYVNEEWCLGCRLCEFNCAFANSDMTDMATALKGKPIYPRIHVEGDDKVSFAVSCRHCTNPICVKSCIAGTVSQTDGVVWVDKAKCVGGALVPDESGMMQKCELCLQNICGELTCVKGCPAAFSSESRRKKFGGVV